VVSWRGKTRTARADNDVVAARFQLGTVAFAQEWQKGRTMKVDDAVMEAMVKSAREATVP
jgi:hypothetical protein